MRKSTCSNLAVIGSFAVSNVVQATYQIYLTGLEELFRSKDQSNINNPEYCQPISTAVQIALVDLLKSFGILATAVVGHSSGEIAAAYVLHQ